MIDQAVAGMQDHATIPVNLLTPKALRQSVIALKDSSMSNKTCLVMIVSAAAGL
jgi:hypothetical protein